KRGSGLAHVGLDSAELGTPGRSLDVLALEEALEALRRSFPRKVQIVEMRFFGGLTPEETAEAAGVSVITVKRDWAFAKAWIFRYLSGSEQAGSEVVH